MHRFRLLVLFGFLLTSNLAVADSPALAAAPQFTLTATNATMSSSGSNGTGSSTFTLTSVNSYAGTIYIGCVPPTPPSGVKVPYCDLSAGPARPPVTLTANQAVTGTLSLVNAPVPCTDVCPVSLPRQRSHGLAPSLALAGMLLFCFGIRRRPTRWLTLTLLAAGALAGLTSISACGGNSSVVTPGTYAYTVSATDESTSVSVSTTINVTVP